MPAVESSRFDASHVWHDFELGVQTAPTVCAEPVLVDLPTVALGIIILGLAYLRQRLMGLRHRQEPAYLASP
jgi:hypothetical protein